MPTDSTQPDRTCADTPASNASRTRPSCAGTSFTEPSETDAQASAPAPVNQGSPFLRHAADALVLVLIVLFSLAATKGSLELSPMGVGMDSDLQNYAQVLESIHHPERLAHDPLKEVLPTDPGVPNLLTIIAGLMDNGTGNAAESILRTGFWALLFHLGTWYWFGRVVFGRPTLAIILSMAMSVTFYWAFGTFWGATHNEPVPRLFYNALWPFILLLACRAWDRAVPRALLFLLLGASVFVHSVSALMNGAIFTTVFFLKALPGEGFTGGRAFARHVARTLFHLVLFFAPVAVFFALRVPMEGVDPAEAALFRAIHALRFVKDWAVVWGQLGDILRTYCTAVPLIPAGVAALVFVFFKRDLLTPLQWRLARLVPLMVLGIGAACLVVFAEMRLAPLMGRLPMSNEVLRGTRFLLPLSILSLALALAPLWARLRPWMTGILAVAGACALLLVSPDKQIVAARLTVSELIGSGPDKAAESFLHRNYLELAALRAVEKELAPEETVLAPDDTMSVRYVAHHALEPVHKDGNAIYYLRDPKLGKSWLATHTALAQSPANIPSVWKGSPAAALLVRRSTWEKIPSDAWTNGPAYTRLFENEGWLLLRKAGESKPAASSVTGASPAQTSPATPQAAQDAERDTTRTEAVPGQ